MTGGSLLSAGSLQRLQILQIARLGLLRFTHRQKLTLKYFNAHTSTRDIDNPSASWMLQLLVLNAEYCISQSGRELSFFRLRNSRRIISRCIRCYLCTR